MNNVFAEITEYIQNASTSRRARV